MKIYRIPKSEAKKFKHYYNPMGKGTYAENRKFENSVDLSQNNEPWHGEKCIEVDISDQQSEKKSVIFIVFEESDVIALHQGLIKGLQEKRDSWEKMKTGEMIENTYSIFSEVLGKTD